MPNAKHLLETTAVSAPQKVNPADAPQIEQRARAFLAERQFRKARDEAKLLCKIDRIQYLPLLIKANLGLSREMLAKGQSAEAQQVISHLITLASAQELHALEMEMESASGSDPQALAEALEKLNRTEPSLGETERHRCADAVVLAFQELSTNPRVSPAMAAEVTAIHEALRAVSEKRWSEAQDFVRPLPRGSVFSHWRLFVRGLTAFHTGDAVRAARSFQELPADTVPARAAQPYRLLLVGEAGNQPTQLPSESVLEALGRLAGQPGLGRPLARAEREWRQNRAGSSYRALREVLTQFPAESVDLMGALTEFYFNSLFHASDERREDLAGYFDEMLMRRSAKNALEQALMYRALSQDDPTSTHPVDLEQDWRGFLNAYEQLHGHNPKLASVAYAWLGEQLAAPAPSFAPGLFPRKQTMRDEVGAVESLERSIRLDPQNLAASLRLCDVLETLKRHSERNRLLDDMTERFPENKAVLLRAARRCVDRKAFAKGLEYLQRARQLDLLDPALADQMVRAYLGQASQYLQKKRLEPARAALDSALTLAVDGPEDFARGRWCLLTQRGVIEQAHGDAEVAEPLLGAARAGSPSTETFLLYAHLATLAWRRMHFSEPTPYSREFLGACLKRATAAGSLRLIRAQEYWSGQDEVEAARYFGIDLIRRYLQAAESHPFTREEARQLVEHTGREGEFFYEAQHFVDRVLSQDRNDPLFRFFRLTANPYQFDSHSEYRREAEGILQEATRRGDSDTAQRARELLSRRSAPPVDPLPIDLLPPPGDAFEDDSGFDEPAPDITAFTPGDAKAMSEIIFLLSGLSEKRIKKLRQQMIRQGMPAEMFDSLVGAARSGSIPPSLPPLPRPPLADPNQMNLFEA